MNTEIAQYFLYLQKVENNLNKSCNAKFANNFFTQKKGTGKKHVGGSH